MTLAERLGFPPEAAWPEDQRSEHYAVALRLAEQLHRANVRVSLEEFAGMSKLEREILARAGERVRAREASLLALAVLGQPEELLGVHDGGEAVMDREFQALVREAMGQLERGRR